MIKYIFGICILLFSGNAFGQSHHQALIDGKFSGQVYIFDKPGGKIIDSAQNNLVDEDFLVLKIMEEKGDFFNTEITLAISGIKKIGWIKKADYIGAYSICSHTQTIYFKPKLKSNQILLTNWGEDFLTIERFKQDWALVHIKYKGETQTGWIPVKELCFQPYTTCCER